LNLQVYITRRLQGLQEGFSMSQGVTVDKWTPEDEHLGELAASIRLQTKNGRIVALCDGIARLLNEKRRFAPGVDEKSSRRVYMRHYMQEWRRKQKLAEANQSGEGPQTGQKQPQSEKTHQPAGLDIPMPGKALVIEF
jgi:hypothetical protein